MVSLARQIRPHRPHRYSQQQQPNIRGGGSVSEGDAEPGPRLNHAPAVSAGNACSIDRFELGHGCLMC